MSSRKKQKTGTENSQPIAPIGVSDDEAINRFLKFLSIKTVSSEGPKGSYQEAVEFLTPLVQEIGMKVKVIELIKKKPILIATLEGNQPNLPSILLNSHYDVVPAVEESWNTPPFNPKVSEDGKIFARGTQDMKCVCMQYIEALLRMTKRGEKFERTIHMTFVPDEEVGGMDGLGAFAQTKEFKDLNIAVALDEGLASPDESFTVFYGERVPWWISFTAKGNAGHGSRFIEKTAAEKILKVVSKAMEFRKEEKDKLHEGCSHSMAKKLGDVTTLNLTVLKGYVEGADGNYAFNVIPTEMLAGFDVRIPPTVDLKHFEEKLNEWASQEDGITWEWSNKNKLLEHHVTSIDEKENKWWKLLNQTLVTEEKKKIVPEIFPAATDSRFIRLLDLPCFGFSPINNTPILLHDHNEYLEKQVFLDGIQIYEKLIKNFANLGE